MVVIARNDNYRPRPGNFRFYVLPEFTGSCEPVHVGVISPVNPFAQVVAGVGPGRGSYPAGIEAEVCGGGFDRCGPSQYFRIDFGNRSVHYRLVWGLG